LPVREAVVGKARIENGDVGGRERVTVTDGGLGELNDVSSDLLMCSGSGGSSVEVEKKRNASGC
jgi:hypothetical protein